MEKNNFNNLSPSDLDKLLNRAFLETDFSEGKNAELLDSIGHRVLSQPVVITSFREMMFNKAFFAISVASLFTSIFLWMDQPGEVKENGKAATTTSIPEPAIKSLTETSGQSRMVFPPEPEKIEIQATVSGKKFVPEMTKPVAEIVKPDSVYPVRPEEPVVTATLPEETSALKEKPAVKETYIFPRLTETEIEDNEQEKKWIAKKAARLKQEKSAEKYCRIPASAGQSLKEFYLGSGEITNLEYRTFLFDLLINNKKEEFLLAKPEQSGWINAGGVHFFDTLSRIYFSSPQYDAFPVVNISAEGAELYCVWLMELANDIRRKEGKPEIEIRLPYEKEWLYAANVGRKDAVFPWFTDSIQNNKNLFFANFCIQKKQAQLKWPVVYPGKQDSTAYTAAGMASGNRKIATLETWSYSPNDFYLYNMCGNVSELVYTGASKQLKTKGGNWNSDFEHLKLTSEDEFKDRINPSPMIGFRVCVTEKK